jgi:hypothetical protein
LPINSQLTFHAADKKFHQLLKQAGERDPLMAEAQNEQFNKAYLDPAFN